MLDQLHCNVVLASLRLVLSCLLLEQKRLKQVGQCRPKKQIFSKIMLHYTVVREVFFLAFKLRRQSPPEVVNRSSAKR